MSTILVIGDLHGSCMHPDAVKFLADIKRVHKPELVVQVGDLWDGYNFSRYLKDPDSPNAEQEIEETIEALRPLYKLFPEMKICYGNHDCISLDTEVLTETGWKSSGEISTNDKIVTFDPRSGRIVPTEIEGVIRFEEDVGYLIRSNHREELVSANHKILLDGQLTPVKDLPARVKSHRLVPKVAYTETAQPFNDYDRLLLSVLADATIVLYGGRKMRIQFKLSKERKIKALRELLDRLEMPYTFRECKKGKTNKLQPYYVRIYGDYARQIYQDLGCQKTRLPKILRRNFGESIQEFFDSLTYLDGHRHYNHVVMSTVDKELADDLQELAARHGIICSTRYMERPHGFPNARAQYHLSIFDRGVDSVFFTEIEKLQETITFVGIQTTTGTLITRRNGKMQYTGNCRHLKKALDLSIPSSLFRSVKDILQTPEGWEFGDYWQYEDEEAGPILFHHGEMFGGPNLANMLQTLRCSHIVGHIHSEGGHILYQNNGLNTVWAANAGCLIDHTSYAFRYAKKSRYKGVNGALLVIDGSPFFLPM